MDISSVAVKSTATLNVLHPQTGEETDISIDVLSPDSANYKKEVSRITKASSKRKGKIPSSEVAAMSIDLLASVTVGWKNLEEGGRKLSFSKENAVKIYTDVPWLRKQVDAFIGDEQNFLQSAESN